MRQTDIVRLWKLISKKAGSPYGDLLMVLPADPSPFLALLLILCYNQASPWIYVKRNEIPYMEFPRHSVSLLSSGDLLGCPSKPCVSSPVYTRHALLP